MLNKKGKSKKGLVESIIDRVSGSWINVFAHFERKILFSYS
ncbi:XyeA family cyclophane-containing RiPP triceptide [Vibrio caribbeanicus]